MRRTHLACLVAVVMGCGLGWGTRLVWGQEMEHPDKKNPDYSYCEDFEQGKSQDGQAAPFNIMSRRGVREGAGCRSKYGYSTVIIENDGLPPYPRWRIPRQEGTFFVHFDLKTPANFYLGPGNHGHYLYEDATQNQGRTALDYGATPAWLDPEWDPYTILSPLRSPGYGSEARSFEGFEPKRRGEWHSQQIMIIPSNKDSATGRIKVWIDGELTVCAKMKTLPAYDTFWLSNYWHSLQYVPQDQGYGNLHEKNTAPPHPAFEIMLDNFIVSKSFIEFGPNKFQVERVRFADLAPDSFTVHFDTTAAAKTVAVEWGTTDKYGQVVKADAQAPGYYHALAVAGLAPLTTYHLRLKATDAKGREAFSPDMVFSTLAAGKGYPDFKMPYWKGEVYGNVKFEGTPAFVRNFNSLSFVSWPGADRDEIVDCNENIAIRYTNKANYKAGSYIFMATAWDGIRVLVDGQPKVDAMRATGGHNERRDFRMDLAEGEHTVVVEHGIWRKHDYEQGYSKYLCFKITPDDKTPPVCYKDAIYDSRFYKPEVPGYCGRWSEDCTVTVDYGETDQYGQTASRFGRIAMVPMTKVEIGKTYHYRVTAEDPWGNKTVLPDRTFVCGDTIAPNKTLIALSRVSDTALELSFTSPGEDSSFKTCASYDVRWSNQPLNITNWDKASKIPNLPQPQVANKVEKITLNGFPKGKQVYVAFQAVDAAGNRSLLSNVVSDPSGPEVMDCDGDGYGVGCLKGYDPDDYDPNVPVKR